MNKFSWAALTAVVLVSAAWAAERLEETIYVPLEHPAIQYDQTPPADRIMALDHLLDDKKVKLDFAPGGLGYLPAVLKQLNVPIDSQVLVFSKTSIQQEHINARAPRAIYFNDDIAVGFVQGGEVLEFTAVDPKMGIRLYTMDNEKSEAPGFARQAECMRCHQGGQTLGVPGLMISSVHLGADGRIPEHGGSLITDQRSPFTERWGGWYVTGTSGSMVHMGNAATDMLDPEKPVERMNVTDLSNRFQTSRYLSPNSDIVALMTLEHQVRMTNLFTRLGWDTRIALYDEKVKDAPGAKFSPATEEKLNNDLDDMVAYMTFANEEPLPDPVKGVSSFTTTFAARGPRDNKGRSLRDFDLKTRLFRYPLSYMVYSAAFDALPQAAKSRLYTRLVDVLGGKDQSEQFKRLKPEDKQAALEILRATKSDLP